jgi:hypothetical protein
MIILGQPATRRPGPATASTQEARQPVPGPATRSAGATRSLAGARTRSRSLIPARQPGLTSPTDGHPMSARSRHRRCLSSYDPPDPQHAVLNRHQGQGAPPVGHPQPIHALSPPPRGRPTSSPPHREPAPPRGHDASRQRRFTAHAISHLGDPCHLTAHDDRSPAPKPGPPNREHVSSSASSRGGISQARSGLGAR